MVVKKMVNLLKEAAIIGLLAGILSALLGGILGMLSLPFAIDKIIILAVVIMLAPASLRAMKVFDLVVFLAAIGIVGTIVSQLVPAAGSWILAVNESFTVSGLLVTFLWLELAMLVKAKLKIKI